MTPEQIVDTFRTAHFDVWMAHVEARAQAARAAAFPPGTARLPRLAVDAH